MVKSRAEMVSLARRHAREAIETLIEILRNPDAPMRVRNAAAATLIARGWIKPPPGPDDPMRNQPSRLQ